MDMRVSEPEQSKNPSDWSQRQVLRDDANVFLRLDSCSSQISSNVLFIDNLSKGILFRFNSLVRIFLLSASQLNSLVILQKHIHT